MKLLVLFWSMAVLAQAPTHRPFNENAFYDLMRAANIFERHLWGCPLEGFPPQIECVAGTGKYDPSEWDRIYDKGHALFGEK